MAFSDHIPDSIAELRDAIVSFRASRASKKEEAQATRGKRRSLTSDERDEILKKTDGRCHICGGPVGDSWQADHVMAHSRAGRHSVDNYLPAHRICNNYRWDYGPEEFQLILKLGVWARTQIERGTGRGEVIAEGFLVHERGRLRRRKDSGA